MTDIDDWANAASNQENLCQKVRSLSLGCTLQSQFECIPNHNLLFGL